jgi:hypothetical protein
MLCCDTFLFCFVSLRSLSYVSNVASVSGISILGYPLTLPFITNVFGSRIISLKQATNDHSLHDIAPLLESWCNMSLICNYSVTYTINEALISSALMECICFVRLNQWIHLWERLLYYIPVTQRQKGSNSNLIWEILHTCFFTLWKIDWT